MEYVVLAFLSSALSTIFDKLSSLDSLKFARQEKVLAEIKKLHGLLLTIVALLEDAEEKQMKSKFVKNWLSNLRDLACDTEDILDEFSTEANRRKLIVESQASTRMVSRLLLTLFPNPNAVLFNIRMGFKLKEITARLEKIVEEKNELDLGKNDGGISKGTTERQAPTSLVFESGVFGRRGDQEAIFQSLLGDDEASNDGFTEDSLNTGKAIARECGTLTDKGLESESAKFQEKSEEELPMQEKIRTAALVNKAALMFMQNLNISCVPEEVNAAGFQICADEIESAGITDRMVTEDSLNNGKAIARECGTLTDKGLENESAKLQEKSEELPMQQASNWSQLQDDLISTIVNRLQVIEDFAAFSLVSRHCRSVCANMNWTTMNWTQDRRPPWLMLSANPDSNRLSFFSLCNNSCCELELPTVRGRRCYGTAEGWIIAVGPDLQACFVHPLRQRDVGRDRQDVMGLPMLSTLKKQVAELTDWFNFIHKFMAFKISHDQFLVMAIYGPLNCLAYAKTGESKWVIVEDVCQFKDVTFFQDCFYALCGRGVLMRCELNGPDSVVHLVDLPPRDLETADKMYLVESSGKLFGVFRYGSANVSGMWYKTESFLVYKFQSDVPDDCPSPRWARVKDLKDSAFFVGHSNSWSICATNNVNCKRNRIYFTDDNWEQQKTIGGTYGGHDIGAFDMASKEIECLNFGVDTPSDYSRPTWSTPTFGRKLVVPRYP